MVKTLLETVEQIDAIDLCKVVEEKTELKKKEKVIGIVGGLGPMASLDLARKILNETNALKDQDHLPVVFISAPHRIVDRTSFLLGEEKTNPAISITYIIRELNKLGANVIGIPCNTSFAPLIYDEILRNLRKSETDVKIVHLIEEVALHLGENYPEISRVGILCTKGLYRVNGYTLHLTDRGFDVILPDEDINQNYIHRAIYDPDYGIKAKSAIVTKKAIDMLYIAINHLLKKGVDAIILGCTELSLAIKDKFINNRIIIDPTTILARSLIREVDESKLRIF